MIDKFDSKTIYRKLVENMNEAVWMGDAEEKTIYANPKFCNLLGYDLEEIIGKKSYDFWDQKSAKRVKEVNEHERKKGESSSYEGNLVTKDGELIPVLLNGTPLPDGGTIGIMTDLRELKRKDELYRKLVENMNEAVWMGDQNEDTVYVNPKLCELIEYTPEELVGKKSTIFWDQKTIQKIKEVNQLERKKGISSTYEGTLITKSGTHIPVLSHGSPLPDGGTIGIMTDLRELRQQEFANELLKNAIEHSSDAIVIFDANLKVNLWNKGAKITFGYKSEEMINTSLEKIFNPDELLFVIHEAQNVRNIELEAEHQSGQPLKIGATFTPVKDHGLLDGYLLIARDITNQSKMEEELEIKYKKIKEAYTELGLMRRQMDYVFELLALKEQDVDKKSITDFIVSSVIMLTRVDACILREYLPEKNQLKLVSSFGVSEDWQGKSVIDFNGSLTERAFKNGSPLKIVDLSRDYKYQSHHLAKKNNLSSLLLIPLIFHGQLLGSLSLYVGPEKKLEIFENDFIEKYAKILEMILGTI
jgi:PAS domain S-box-containing protein